MTSLLCRAFYSTAGRLSRSERGRTPGATLRDREILRHFEAVERMSEDDRRVVTSLIDAYVKKHQIEDVLHQ